MINDDMSWEVSLFKSHLRSHYSTAFIHSTLTCALLRTHSSFAPIKLRFDRQTLATRLHKHKP